MASNSKVKIEAKAGWWRTNGACRNTGKHTSSAANSGAEI